MADGEDEQEVRSEGGGDLYAVLGLKKECSTADLRSAYKKLALRWHPDRCSAAGSGRSAEEAKSKFQAIQEAYSVLSDASKRSLYDVGGLHGGGDDADAMGDFLGEMVAMMNQTAPTAGGSETFEELQRLFFEMFESDVELLRESPSRSRDRRSSGFDFSPSSSSCGGGGGGGGGYKRDGAELFSDQAKAMAGVGDVAGLGAAGVFCVGLDDRNTSSPAAKGQGGGGGKRRAERKQQACSRFGVSSLCRRG